VKIAHLDDPDWLDAPPMENVESAEFCSIALGQTAAQRRNGSTPRTVSFASPFSRILVEALDQGVGEDGCLLRQCLHWARSEKNDLLAAVDLPQDHVLRQHRDNCSGWLDYGSKRAMMARSSALRAGRFS
jgi:ATP-dependent helicase HrpB